MSSDLQTHVNKFLSIQHELYEKDPTFELPHPHYLLIKDDALFKVVPMEMPRQLGKIMRDALSVACDAFGVDTFLHVSEAWAKQVTMDEVKDKDKDEEGFPVRDGSLQDDPESVECLIIYAGERSGRRICEQWQINRSGKTREEFLTLINRWDNSKEEDAAKGSCDSHWDLWDRPSLRTKN